MKRFTAILLIFCLLFTAGCAARPEGEADVPEKTGGTEAATAQTTPQRMMDAEYFEEYYPFPGGYFNGDVARLDDRLMILGARAWEEQPEQTEQPEQGEAEGQPDYMLALTTYSLEENGRVNLEPARHISLDEGYVNCLTAGGDGYFYVQTAAEAGYSGEYSILRYDSEGQLTDRMEISGWPADSLLTDIQVTGDGRLILIGDTQIAACPWQGESLETMETGGVLTGSAMTGKGLVAAAWMEKLGIESVLIDPENLSVSPLFGEGQEEAISFFYDTQGLDGELVINTGSCYELWEMDSMESRELIKWNYNTMSQDIPGSSVRLSEDSFLCAFKNKESLLLCGVEQTSYVERQPLEIALVGVSDYSLGDTRELSKSYDISTRKYEEVDKFSMDMISGNCPDLVLFCRDLDTSGNAYEDLYPYIDGDDEFSRDSFLPGLLPALETNGQLHSLWDMVTIYTIVGRTADVGDGKGLTPADCTRIVEESPQYKAVFEGFMSDTNLLGWLSTMSMGSFVNWAEGTCSFDSPEFMALLAWCGDMGKDMFEGEIYTGPQYDSSEIFLFFSPVQTLKRLDVLGEVYGEPVSVVGFPDGDEGISFFSLDMGIAMAIPSGAENKDSAWAFIKDRLSLEKQLPVNEWAGIPVTAEAVQRGLDNYVRPEGQEFFNQLLERTKYAEQCSDQKLREIIIENGKTFLNGDKSLEEAAGLIQSKAGIYLAERK